MTLVYLYPPSSKLGNNYICKFLSRYFDEFINDLHIARERMTKFKQEPKDLTTIYYWFTSLYNCGCQFGGAVNTGVTSPHLQLSQKQI